MKNLKDFVLRENDIERNGHIYCKVCGKRVDGELLDLGFTKFIPRIKCKCEIKRDKENEERERLMKISSLKRDCFSSPLQHQYNFEKYLNEKGQAYKVAYNYAKSFEQMTEDNVGLLFYGNIGKEIGRMAKALHMNISYYDIKDRSEFKKAEEEIGAEFVDFDQGLKNADYIVLQMNYTEDNYHIIGEDELDKMKESAYLINTARGGIVDESALYKALKNGKIAGAAIDTHEEEPKINEDLKKLDNVVLTPHIGNTFEARIEMANSAANDIIRVFDGKRPKNLVED